MKNKKEYRILTKLEEKLKIVIELEENKQL
jgi:hypothetical protein